MLYKGRLSPLVTYYGANEYKQLSCIVSVKVILKKNNVFFSYLIYIETFVHKHSNVKANR